MSPLTSCLALVTQVVTLFAEATPTWTDKDVIGLLATILTGVIGGAAAVVVGFFRYFSSEKSKLEEKSAKTISGLEEKLIVAREDADKQRKIAHDLYSNAKYAELETQLKESHKQLADEKAVGEQLAAELANTRNQAVTAEQQAATFANQLDGANGDIAHLTANLAQANTIAADSHADFTTLKLASEQAATAAKIALETTTASRDQYKKLASQRQARLEKALGVDGHIWDVPISKTDSKFPPLHDLRMPIISVLNLKGGVGKTTLTANLASAFAHLGFRVLLVDLDLQGSLSSMMLSAERQGELEEGKRVVADFFRRGVEDPNRPELGEYCESTDRLPGAGSAIIPTADSLAYAELNLTLRWLFKEGKRDPRFLLRHGLRHKKVRRRFDLVLIDCPPLMNISCVNALAASDYLLVPTMPSQQATMRVPALLKRIHGFREHLCPSLELLGLVANRAGSQIALSGPEQDFMKATRDHAQAQWQAGPVHVCEAFIPQNRCFPAAEYNRRPLQSGDELFEALLRLAREIEGRLPEPCRKSAPQVIVQEPVT